MNVFVAPSVIRSAASISSALQSGGRVTPSAPMEPAEAPAPKTMIARLSAISAISDCGQLIISSPQSDVRRDPVANFSYEFRIVDLLLVLTPRKPIPSDEFAYRGVRGLREWN